MNSQKRNTQNLHLKEENSSRFYSWGLQRNVVIKDYSIAFFLAFSFFSVAIKRLLSLRALQLAYVERFTLLFLAMTAALLSLACWYFHISRIADRLGYDMGRSVVLHCWTCLETCLELQKSRYLIWWINSTVPEGSMITSENSSATRESSRGIILKSRLNSTGHSACTSEARDIFDRQTNVPNDWWQLMCSNVLQTRDRRNSMTALVRNITMMIIKLNYWLYVAMVETI